jgi:hypothetical protein
MSEVTAPESAPEEITEETAPEETVPSVTEEDLNDLARMVLATQVEMVNRYNSAQARIDAATGDTGKYVHEIRNSSEDPKVVKFRKFEEDLTAKLEKAVAEIEAYIRENLVGDALTPEQIEEEKNSLKALKSEIDAGEGFFAVATKALGADASHLLPKRSNARKSVSSGGTGNGGVKPRVTGVYIDDVLCSHTVPAKGDKPEREASTFTDAVKHISDTLKTKVEVKDLQGAYFAAAGVKPEDWATAPDKVEFSYAVGEKNVTVLVTK